MSSLGAPEAFVIPTTLLAEIIRLVGSLPAGQRVGEGRPSVARIYLQLEQLVPVEPPAPTRRKAKPKP